MEMRACKKRHTQSKRPSSSFYPLEEDSINNMITAFSQKIEEILPQLIQEALEKCAVKETNFPHYDVPAILTEEKEILFSPSPLPLLQPSVPINYLPEEKETSFSQFAEKQIATLKRQKRPRTASNYQTAVSSLACFLKKETIPFRQITEEQMTMYQEWLRSKELNLNTVSCYMRTLRSIYNKAVKAKLIPQSYPFRNVYTKIGETNKRAISVQQMQKLKSLMFVEGSVKNLVRDLFLFCFFTRGMSFVDLAYLRKQQVRNGRITYKRHKTHQEISIKLEPCMQKIMNRYAAEESEYVFPIITSTNEKTADTQYRSKECYYNRLLKELGKMAKIEIPLSFYVARHTWASLAFQNKVGLEIISKALGHTSLKTTLIYIKNIGKESAINKANSQLIQNVFFDK